MGTKKQEKLKKVIFEETKKFKTVSDIQTDIDIELLKKAGIKFSFDKSKDYFGKTTEEIQLLKEQKEQKEKDEKE